MARRQPNKGTGKGLLSPIPPGPPTLENLWSMEERFTSAKDPKVKQQALQELQNYQQQFSQTGQAYRQKPPANVLEAEKLTAAQIAANEAAGRQQERFNRPNENTTFGTLNYTQNPDGSTTRTTQLSPFEQTKYDQQSYLDMESNRLAGDLLGQAGAQFRQPMDLSGLPQAPGDVSQFRQGVEDNVFNSYKRRLDQTFGEQQSQLQQSLADRGIAPGSERWNREMDQFQQSRSDAFIDAQTQAMLQGRGEAESRFNMMGAARDRGYQEAVDQRNRPFNEMTSVLGNVKGPIMPQFQAMQPVNTVTPDMVGAGLTIRGQDQEERMQQRQIDATKSMMKGGGGGGGGGAPAPETPSLNFNTPGGKVLRTPPQMMESQAPATQAGGKRLGIFNNPGGAAQAFGAQASQAMYGQRRPQQRPQQQQTGARRPTGLVGLGQLANRR